MHEDIALVLLTPADEAILVAERVPLDSALATRLQHLLRLLLLHVLVQSFLVLLLAFFQGQTRSARVALLLRSGARLKQTNIPS